MNKIGKGGFGEVFEAFDPLGQQIYAIKKIKFKPNRDDYQEGLV